MQLSDAEWKVMDAVWKRHPATVRDVLETVETETGWAYSTVKTFLGRLVDKGALGVEKRGNSSVFRPLISRRQARRSALRSLVEKAFGGAFAPLVHQLVDEEPLSEGDRAELRRLLDEAGPGAGESPTHDRGSGTDPRGPGSDHG
ncbi:MAG: BlaI/MecI/CopY family transcriptional regulator [Holophagales bacterium]|nr:BlaI/MecI/CopY family transcriptional regulator [Holophagales bacterium]